MLEYDRIDISEGIDINRCEETSARCSLCKFYYFLDKNFSYGPFLCNGCYDMSLKQQLFVLISHTYYAYNLIKNATIIDKKGTL